MCPLCKYTDYRPLFSDPQRVECANCKRHILRLTWEMNASNYHAPKQIAAGPVAVRSTDQDTTDVKPDGSGYTVKVPRMGGVPARDFSAAYLARWRADMLAGEGSYGLGVDTLAGQYPLIYSKAAIARGLA